MDLRSQIIFALQVHKVLYLIGLGLAEEGRDRAEQGTAAEQGVFTRLALEKVKHKSDFYEVTNTICRVCWWRWSG
jgi:hypothetical protein